MWNKKGNWFIGFYLNYEHKIINKLQKFLHNWIPTYLYKIKNFILNSSYNNHYFHVRCKMMPLQYLHKLSITHASITRKIVFNNMTLLFIIKCKQFDRSCIGINISRSEDIVNMLYQHSQQLQLRFIALHSA